ncbi:glycosyltransferase family 4 protein [Pedobacter sp. JCM 36344]|uniref:glycosyltransferase family 4 protein n=1 Tax=Pedobacter sp. JCM 36344 TaxID=3374280 RepID=UPI00397B28FF
MVNVIFAYLISGVLSASVIPWIISFSLKLKLFDVQDLYRKTHVELVSRMGGISIFFGYFLIMQVYADFNNIDLHALIASSSIMFLLGLKDDLLGGAAPSEKFIIQLLAALVLVIFSNLDLDIYLCLIDVPSLCKLMGFVLLACSLLVIVNAFNFIDGINGLAGILGVLVNLFLGSCLVSLGDDEFAISAFVIAGSTTGFLIYNLIPGKVFMGDSGAMLIGLTTGAICLRFISLSINSNESPFSSPVLIIIALLIVPIFDVLRILFIRSLHGKPLLVGDRNHIHHRLRDLGISDFQVVQILVVFTTITVSLVILVQNADVFTSSIVLTLLCIFSNTALSYYRGRRLFANYKFSDVLFIDTLNRR